MATKPGAGDLRGLYSFQKKGDVDDGFGNVTPGAGPFEQVFKAAGELKPLRGGETVMAGRLLGQQTYALTFRSHPQARTVTTDWRVVDVRTNKMYQIKSPASDSTQKNSFLDMLVQEGVVT